MPSSFAAVRYFQQVAFQPQGRQLALPARRFVPALPEELPDMSADPSLQLEDGVTGLPPPVSNSARSFQSRSFPSSQEALFGNGPQPSRARPAGRGEAHP